MRRLGRQGWEDQAACASGGLVTDLFFDRAWDDDKQEAGPELETARAICGSCPVQTECLAAGLGEPYGVRAKLTPLDRRKVMHHMALEHGQTVSSGPEKLGGFPVEATVTALELAPGTYQAVSQLIEEDHAVPGARSTEELEQEYREKWAAAVEEAGGDPNKVSRETCWDLSEWLRREHCKRVGLDERPVPKPKSHQPAAGSRPASGGGPKGGAKGQAIVNWLLAHPEGGTTKEVAEAVGCSTGRVSEVYQAHRALLLRDGKVLRLRREGDEGYEPEALSRLSATG